MECTECKNYVSAYVDRELTRELESRVKEHLQRCPDCRVLVDAELRVKTSLREAYHPEKAPVALRASLRRRMTSQSNRGGRFRLLLDRPILSFASVAAAVFIVYLGVRVFHSVQNPEQMAGVVKTKMVGHLECISCYLSETEHIKKYCDQYGHYIGLITDSNEIYSFFPNKQGKEIQSHLDYIHTDVELTGWVFHQANFIEVENYKLLNQTVTWNIAGGSSPFLLR